MDNHAEETQLQELDQIIAAYNFDRTSGKKGGGGSLIRACSLIRSVNKFHSDHPTTYHLCLLAEGNPGGCSEPQRLSDVVAAADPGCDGAGEDDDVLALLLDTATDADAVAPQQLWGQL